MPESMTQEQGAQILAALGRVEGLLGQLLEALADEGDDGSLTSLDGIQVGGERDMTRSLG